MKKLTSDFVFDSSLLNKKILELGKEFDERNIDSSNLRDRVLSNFQINRLIPKISKTDMKFLSVDSSTVKKELRHCVIWGIHYVTLYARFDGNFHKDPILGGNDIIYTDLMYDSSIDIENIRPYGGIELRSNLMRISSEYNSVLNSYKDLKSNGVNPDYILIDGSLYTTLKALKRTERYPEHNSALEVNEKLLKTGKVIGMVEDSHSTDIARKLKMDMTNLMLFEIALEPNEYVVETKENINICYIKLPVKKLSYLPSRRSNPIVVRWEFPYPDFEDDLRNIIALWCMEDDLLHPQLYPLRITDYLTRKIKIGGIIDEVIRNNGLDLKYREMREG